MNGFSAAGRWVVITFLVLALLVMFIAAALSVKTRVEQHFLSKTVASIIGGTESAPASAPAATGAAPQGPGTGLAQEQSDALLPLMQELQTNPNNAEALTGIANIFMSAGEWGRAETFLERAILSKPGDIRPRYMLGIARFKQNRPAEAAKTFEELLQIREDPAAMYNLAILYKHHLNRPDEARALLEKALKSPDTDEALAGKIKVEL